MNTEHDRMDASHSNARLYFSALGVYSLFISVGAYVAWSAPAIPKLNEMGIPAEKVTLMASIPGLAPGSLITMFGIDTIGRKGTLLVAWLALMLCWVLSCITQQIDVLLIARFIGGWGMSCAFSASGIYISEISDLDSRAFLNSINTIFGGVGCIVAVSTGPFLSFSNFIIEITCLTIIFGLIYLFLPESPYFFVSKGNMHKARSVVVWLRKGSPDKYIDREMSEIKKIIEEEKKNKTGVRKLFSSKVVFKQLSFALFMLYFQQATAYNAVSNYSMAIFQKADINFDAAYMMIALSVSMMIFALPTPFLMKYIGNKKISIVTGIGCAIINCVLGVYFLLLERSEYDMNGLSFIPIIGMLALSLFANIGQSGLVWGVVSELFPPSVKGMAIGILGIISTLLGFVATQVFGTILEMYGYGVTFLGFGIVLIISVFGFFFTPNTSRMSLIEIQGYFENKVDI